MFNLKSDFLLCFWNKRYINMRERYFFSFHFIVIFSRRQNFFRRICKYLQEIIMKKFLSTILAVIIVVSTIFCIAVPAFAATTINCKTTAGGGNSTYFYATVPKNKSGSINLNMTKGEMKPISWSDNCIAVYASYEIKVWRYTGGKWVLEQDFDAYRTSSKSITLKKYSSAQKYKIQVYSWKTSTTLNSYIDKFPFERLFFYSCGGHPSSPTWNKMPTCKATAGSNCTLYTNCP